MDTHEIDAAPNMVIDNNELSAPEITKFKLIGQQNGEEKSLKLNDTTIWIKCTMNDKGTTFCVIFGNF